MVVPSGAAQTGAQPPDQAVQAVGGEQEDQDDRRAVEVAGRFGGADRAVGGAGGGHQRELVGVTGHQQRQCGDEHGADGGSGHRSESADDDHGEVVDGQHEAEVVGHHAAEGEGEQYAGQARVHRRHHEGRRAVAGDVDAHHGGRGLAVAQRHQGASGTASQQPSGGEPGDREQREPEVPQSFLGAERHAQQGEFGVGGEGEAAHFQGWHRAAVESAGDGVRGEQDMVSEEDQGQGGDAEVDAAHPAGDGTEQPAGRTGEQHREYRGDDGGQPRAGFTGQPYVAVGTHGQEEGVAEGELAGGAGQQAQAHRADGRRHGEQADAQPERVEVEGQRAQDGDGREGPAQADHLGAGESFRHGPPPFRRTARWAESGAPAPSPRRARRRRIPRPGRAGRTGSRRRGPR